jgi:hypothetical protein
VEKTYEKDETANVTAANDDEQYEGDGKGKTRFAAERWQGEE